VLGYDRAAMLQRLLPESAADEAARRNAELGRRLASNEAAQKGLIAELGGDTSPAASVYRTRIREYYTEFHDAAAALQIQLDALTGKATSENDPALIAELPLERAAGMSVALARVLTARHVSAWHCLGRVARRRQEGR
jgi:hypothetical protein